METTEEKITTNARLGDVGICRNGVRAVCQGREKIGDNLCWLRDDKMFMWTFDDTGKHAGHQDRCDIVQLIKHPGVVTILERQRVVINGTEWVIAESNYNPDRVLEFHNLRVDESLSRWGFKEHKKDILWLEDSGLFHCTASEWKRVQRLVADFNGTR